MIDDTSLATLVERHAKSDPRTREGVEATFALAEALNGEPTFSKPIMVVSGNGSHGWYSQFAAQCMLSLVRRGRSANDAVAWFRKAPSIERGVGGAVKVLYGVQCGQRVAISDEIALLPFTDLPQSRTRDWLIEQHDRANELPSLHGFKAPPTAALYRAGVVEPIFVHGPTDPSSEPAIWFADLDNAARLLMLIPKAIPIEAAHWLHFDDPDVDLLCQFGVARSTPELQPQIWTSPVSVAESDVSGLLVAYRGLKPDDRQRLNLALDRIIRSRCQFVSGNRAIDLAIALEVLFMNADRDEHSYKISLRAARLLPGDQQVRHRNFGLVRRLYDMRSALVHTGSVKNEYGVNGVRLSAHDIVEAVDVICIEAARAFLGMGGIPDDWKAIELG